MPDATSSTISATLARLGVAETALGAVGATIARRVTTAPIDAPLPRLSVDGPSGAGDLLAKGELGRGGMGIVHLAEQRSIGRFVAVKTCRSDDGSARRALVREARIMGGLEHPNVVPVHALGADANGEPVLVMKRVEGVSWRTLLDQPDHEAWATLLAGHDDRARANVEILAQVARALAFAHDRGIIHRDLKPDNVMLGRFGEVYVLDWGLALRLEERDREPEAIVGTPGYLAPEMARGVASAMDERTDVYLLGATLFELLTGGMPHAAPTTLGALASALAGDIPELPASAPSDLAELVRRSLALEPAERPASAEAFRTGLAAHLISHEADVLIERAARAMAGTEPGDGSTDALRSLLEARFALRAALDLRPGDPRAIERLDLCTTRMIERELTQRNLAGTRGLAKELSRPDPRVDARIQALAEELERERAAVESARRAREEADISKAFPIIAAIAAVLSLLVAPFLVRADIPMGTPAEALATNVGIAVAIGIGTLLGRRRVMATPGSRRVTAFMVLWALSQSPAALVELMLGMTVHRQALALTAGLLVAATGAILVLRGLWLSVLLHALAIAACVRWPAHEVEIVPIFVTVNVGVIFYALRRRSVEILGGGAT